MLTPEELRIRNQNIFSMLKDKRNFVKKYGKDAERVMYSIATKQSVEKVRNNKLIPKYKLKNDRNI